MQGTYKKSTTTLKMLWLNCGTRTARFDTSCFVIQFEYVFSATENTYICTTIQSGFCTNGKSFELVFPL